MRHAKSSPAEPGMSDHERPLDAKGSSDAPQMAQQILKLGYAPQMVLCSDAKRTLATWRGMASFFSPQTPFVSSAKLYESGAKAYLEFIEKQDFSGHTLLVIGHNPSTEDLLTTLSNEKAIVKPANLAVLETHAESWAQALSQFGLWKLVKVHSC